MGKGCPFREYDHGYYCLKTKEEVGSAVYEEYCGTWDYDQCPFFKNEGSSSGGCYLTSACVEYKGLPDDCRELMTLRYFRDEWLRKQPSGEEEIREYYEIAPKIVRSIKESEDADMVWDKLYQELVLPCVHMIDEKEYGPAHDLYLSVTEDLKQRYLH